MRATPGKIIPEVGESQLILARVDASVAGYDESARLFGETVPTFNALVLVGRAQAASREEAIVVVCTLEGSELLDWT